MKSSLLAAVCSFTPTLAALDPFSSHNDDFALALKSAIAALTSTVVFLFFWFRTSYKKIERQLEDRDAERNKHWRKISKLEKWAGMMANCPAAVCPYRDVQLDDGEGEEGP